MHCPVTAIQTRRLSKTLGGRMVLCNIDLEIATGECIALTGDNGAGKTTLLRCLAAIARPTSGDVRWFGQPAVARPDQRRMVGVVTPDSHLYPHLTLRENLVFAARMCGATAPGRQADRWLEQTGLRPQAGRQARQISRGMRQRLALARALIHNPRILLLDEPFSGLDSTSRQWLVELLRQQRADGGAVCFSTHDPQPAWQIADRTLILQDGSVASQQAAVQPFRDNRRQRVAA